MSVEKIIGKKKIRADDYITFLLAISYLLFVLFFRRAAFLSISIYPMVALIIYGVIKIIKAFNKRNNEDYRKTNQILFGTIAIIFSILFLNFLLIQPNITPEIIISLISFPLLIVGYAAIIKGLVVDKYSVLHRLLSIAIGTISVVICLLSLFNLIYNFLYNIILLLLVILFNVFSRAALYLSEYGLSLIHIKNFILFLYIISDYIVINIDRNGNMVLEKIN